MQRIRSKEAKLQLVVDGDLKAGPFAKVTNFSVEPQATIEGQRFVGEARADYDLDVEGVRASFTNQLTDHRWFELWRQIERAEENGDALPSIVVIATYRYRGGVGWGRVKLHGQLVLKLDTVDAPETGYATTAWSLGCKFAT